MLKWGEGGSLPEFSPPDLKRDIFVKHKIFEVFFFEEGKNFIFGLDKPSFLSKWAGNASPA